MKKRFFENSLLFIFIPFLNINYSRTLTINKDINQSNIVFFIKNDSINNIHTLYLSLNGELSDSISVNRQDKIWSDSLSKINDTLWYYYYLDDYDNAGGRYTQFLIKEKNHKIHICYTSTYTFQHKSLYDSSYTFLKFKLLFSDFSSNKLTINYTLFDRTMDFKRNVLIDSTHSTTSLLYNIDNGIYYTSKIKLFGVYKFYIKIKEGSNTVKKEKNVYVENEEVFILEVGGEHYLYYKGKWFFAISGGYFGYNEIDVTAKNSIAFREVMVYDRW